MLAFLRTRPRLFRGFVDELAADATLALASRGDVTKDVVRSAKRVMCHNAPGPSRARVYSISIQRARRLSTASRIRSVLLALAVLEQRAVAAPGELLETPAHVRVRLQREEYEERGKMDSSAAVLQSAGKSSAAERLRDTHRLLVVLVMAHAGEEVDAQGAAGGHGKHGDGPPLVHLGCGRGRGEGL